MRNRYTKKTYVIMCALAVLFLTAACTEKKSEKAEEKNYNLITEQLKSDFQDMVLDSISFNIDTVSSLSEKAGFSELVKYGEPDTVKQFLGEVASEIRQTTEHKNIKLHMHSMDGFSVARSWDDEHKRDNLAFYRHSIHYAKKSGEVISGFELGRIGLVLRSVMPFYSGAEMLGTVESIQEIDPIVEHLKAKDVILLFTMNKNKLPLAEECMDFETAQELVVMQGDYNAEMLAILREIDLHKLYTEPYILKNSYLITSVEIFDVSNITSGLAVLAKKL